VRHLEDSDEAPFLLSDGRVLTSDAEVLRVYAAHFCLDNFFDPVTGDVYLSGFVGVGEPFRTAENLTIVDDDDDDLTCGWLRLSGLLSDMRRIYSVCGGVSIVFLVMAIFFYSTLPELANFQGYIREQFDNIFFLIFAQM
jgi:hypothetical protein